MKSFTSGKLIFCALSFCVLIGATSARAEEYSLRVDVPFQFLAGGTLYPAGDYQFTVDSSAHVLKIRGQANKGFGMVPLTLANEWRSGSDLDKATVRFSTAGGVHVLDGVWKAGSSSGDATYRTKPAKETLSSRADN